MVVSTKASLGISIVSCILIFSGLQMYRNFFGSTRLLTLVAGYSASWFFICLLTAVNNLETIVFGKGFQAQVIPEIASCLLISCVVAGLVHRVSITVCVLSSLLALYYINKQGQVVYAASSTAVPIQKKKK